jgi:hypothetical protein
MISLSCDLFLLFTHLFIQQILLNTHLHTQAVGAKSWDCSPELVSPTPYPYGIYGPPGEEARRPRSFDLDRGMRVMKEKT